MYDYLIIGGGITGVSVARLLQKKGKDNLLILEADKEPGGLCRTKEINGHILDIGGGHFLCSVYPEVYDFIFSHIPKKEFNSFVRVSKIDLDDNIIDYPIESNLWQLPMEKQAQYLISAIQSGEVLGQKEPKNYEQWIRWKLGNEVADSYMIPYNQKIWGVKPKEMDIDWLNKVPRLNTMEIVLSSLSKFADRKKMPSHSTFLYPKRGGFQVIFDAIYKKVKDRIQLNAKVKKMRREKGYWVINDTFRAKKIINTAPWSDIHTAFGKPKRIERHIRLLKANTVVVSLWEKPYTHDWHWLYIPDMKKRQHREFYMKNFALASKKTGYFTETNRKRWPGSKKPWLNKKRPIFEHVNPYAYPIPVIGHANALEKVQEYFRPLNLFGVGRWGQWKYFNMDVCIWHAMKLVEKI